MARREHFILFLFMVTVISYGVQGIDVDIDSAEDDTWTYYVTTPKPEIIKNLHRKLFQNGPSIESLVVDNPSIQILMEKGTDILFYLTICIIRTFPLFINFI